MKNLRFILIGMFLLSSFFSPSAFAGSCDTTPPPSSSSPGGDHANETFSVEGPFVESDSIIFNSDPSTITFQNGYFEEFSGLLNALEATVDGLSSYFDMLASVPLLVIPSGGLYGLENSTFFKAHPRRIRQKRRHCFGLRPAARL